MKTGEACALFHNVCENGHEWPSFSSVESADDHLRRQDDVCWVGADLGEKQMDRPDLSNACRSRVKTTRIGTLPSVKAAIEAIRPKEDEG